MGLRRPATNAGHRMGLQVTDVSAHFYPGSCRLLRNPKRAEIMPPTLALTCVSTRRRARRRPCPSPRGGRTRSGTVLLSRVRAAGPDSLPSRSRAASRRSAASRALRSRGAPAARLSDTFSCACGARSLGDASWAPTAPKSPK